MNLTVVVLGRRRRPSNPGRRVVDDTCGYALGRCRRNIFERSGYARIRRLSLNTFIKWSDEKFILCIFLQVRHGVTFSVNVENCQDVVIVRTAREFAETNV